MNTPLLLPGTLCDARLWADVTLPAGTRVVNTVRGRSLEEAAWMTLDGAPEQLHLVGFSLGAIVAFEVLRQAPDRVARLTLISANPHRPTEAQLGAWDQQELQVQAGCFQQLAATLAPAGRQRQAVLEMALRVGPDVFCAQLQLLRSRPDSRDTLASYRGPLTLLVGQDDPVTPPHLAAEMKALAPQARLQVIQGAGHHLPLDAPQAVANTLRETAYA